MPKLIVVVAVCLALLGAALAQACSCIPPPPPKEALEKSQAVFSGKVTKIDAAGDLEKAVTLEVATAWKGIEKKTIVLYTANDEAACGYGFELGKSYLVYAYSTKRGAEKALETNICTRTTALANAKEDLKELGEGKKMP